jgi:hypothetical protein
VVSAGPEGVEPAADAAGVDAEELGDLVGGVSLKNPLHRELSPPLQLRR